MIFDRDDVVFLCETPPSRTKVRKMEKRKEWEERKEKRQKRKIKKKVRERKEGKQRKDERKDWGPVENQMDQRQAKKGN